MNVQIKNRILCYRFQKKELEEGSDFPISWDHPPLSPSSILLVHIPIKNSSEQITK